MDNTQTKATPSFQVVDGQKFDFNKIWGNFVATFNPALELFKKDPLNFILIFALPVIFVALILLLLLPLVLGFIPVLGAILLMIIALVAVIAMPFVKFFAYGCSLRAVSEKQKKGKIDFKEIFAFVRKHFIDAVKLAVKVFIYTQMWIPLAIALGAGVFAALGLLPIAGLLSLAFLVSFIVLLVMNYGKMIRSSFSMLYFFESDMPKVDEAFNASLAMGEGKTFTIFYNYFLTTLIVGIGSSIIAAILGAILGIFSQNAAALAQEIAAAAVGIFYVILQYSTKWQAEKLAGFKKQ